MSMFKPATRKQSRLRMALDGPSGSGKTFTALRMATGLGKKIAVINSESGAVEKYLGLAPDGVPFEFDILTLDDFAPTKYTEAILAAGKAGYDVLIIDSLSHAWAGAGGALELKDRKGGNSFTAWKDITPMHNQMIEAILKSPCHVIATMRSKTEYVIETDGRGRQIPRKVGMAPIQRAGMEYEFDLYCSIDFEHIMTVSKTRCPEVADHVSVKPGAAFIEPVYTWLNTGSTAPPEAFAVTEADLKRLEYRQTASIPSEPAKTAEQIMKEALAKSQAKEEKKEEIAKNDDQPGEEKQPETEVAAKAEAEGDSTAEQRAELASLYAKLSIGPEAQQTILAKRGLSVVRSLSSEQITEIIERLREKAKAVVAGPATEGGADITGQNAMRETDPCTDDQVAEIKRLVSELEQTKPGTSADFVARLNGAGFKKIAEMNWAQALDLKKAIESDAIAAFFDSQFATAAAG